jgi:hypothetical protein
MKRSFLLCLAPLMSVSTLVAAEPNPTLLDSVMVREVGQDPGEDASECQNFVLDAEEVKAFFVTATIPAFLSVEQIMGVPCYVRGTAKLDGQIVSWEIRADGIARLGKEGAMETYAGRVQ